MAPRLENWKRNLSLLPVLYEPMEVELLNSRIADMPIEHIAYCSFENRFAQSGGLAAVTKNVLPFLQELAGGRKAFLLTPFYPKIVARNGQTEQLRTTGQTYEVEFEGRSHIVELFEYSWSYGNPGPGTMKEYFLRCDGFFMADNALKNPYVYNEKDPFKNNMEMARNSLFFCKAVPKALQTLGCEHHTLLHLQEWQTALVSLTAKEAIVEGTLESCATVQTMHNPFDCFIPSVWLQKLVDNPKRKEKLASLELVRPGQTPPFVQEFTAYAIGLQLVDGPISTVSENFAEEFTTDLLQREYFAPHLQEIFRNNGVFGVNNGMFVPFNESFAGSEGTGIEAIAAVKRQKRKELLEILDSYHPPGRFGQLTWRGGSIANLPDNTPIIAMTGRLDPSQKGFDILLRAIEKFRPDEIKAVLAPMATRESDLDYFHEVASKCSGNLTVFTGRMEVGYNELLAGSTFGMMPSIYEPFGAAIEYLANGTVVICRATGGLVNQISPLENGLVYREPSATYSVTNIRDFMDAGDIVQMRKRNRWAQGMSEALLGTLREACSLFREDPETYYSMIQNGFVRTREFAWDRTAMGYFQLFKKAVDAETFRK